MTGSNPIQVYNWLCRSIPKTVVDRKNWKDCASSLLVYCSLPTYLMLGYNEELKIRKLAHDYNIILDNHLDDFNKSLIV